jgi:hypothetical protein
LILRQHGNRHSICGSIVGARGNSSTTEASDSRLPA